MEINTPSLLIQKRIQPNDMLLPVQGLNRYDLLTENNHHLYSAYEKPVKKISHFLFRLDFFSYRPFTLHVINSEKQLCLSITHPFRYYFQEVNVFQEVNIHENRTCLGTVKRKLSLSNRLFHIYNSNGSLLCEIRGAFWSPWQFRITRDNKTYGSIKRIWRSKSSRKAYPHTLKVLFPDGANDNDKALLLAATLLIDVIFYPPTSIFDTFSDLLFGWLRR